ncbi:MAG: hypothetical protein EZS28_009350 [Streblomastix strix]|uniref:Uncharacterized protein n=1 Tax=Streblomastix strix TaxID=222440 RepID=A0A5J4WJK0_9EUKA|nr:MAG: hypothetical protein EZS28_009350 [Streblomastix strix]
MKEQLRGESKKNSRRKKTKLQKYVFDEQKVEDTEIINDDIEEDEFADGNIMVLYCGVLRYLHVKILNGNIHQWLNTIITWIL